jgi:hypothetical protein
VRFAVRCEWDRTLVHVLGSVDRTIPSENHSVFFPIGGGRRVREREGPMAVGGGGGVLPSVLLVTLLFSVVNLLPSCLAEIKHLTIKDDSRPFILFETFGFEVGGVVNITIIDAKLPEGDRTRMGFFLSTFADLLPLYNSMEADKIDCLLDNDAIRVLFTLQDLLRAPDEKTPLYPMPLYRVPTSDEYSLFFENCLRAPVTMEVTTSMYNKENGSPDYLPMGQTQLPLLYFTFFLVHAVLLGIWIYICWRQRLSVHRIHILMAILIVLKALNLICEAEDKQFVKRTGTPHGWDVAYYIFNFLRGGMLFIVIILIGTGWSFLKPYLQDKEKKLLMIVIPLQVFANAAFIVYDESGPSQKDFFTLKQVFLLLDIICCCAVLFPIVWSIKHLREASQTDGKAARNLAKLMLFRQYYIVVVSYIYFTRIVVFALQTVTAYQYRWASNFAEEMAALAFYIYTGYKFRPVVHNPYFVLDDEEEEAAAQEALKDDEFDL